MSSIKQKVKKDPLDRYYTPAWVTELLVEDWPFPETVRAVWEPCAGEGHISKALGDHILDVWSSDIANVGRSSEFDFLNGDLDRLSGKPERLIHGHDRRRIAIVTNPPYSIPGATAADFVRKALEYTPYVAMLLRLAWLEGAAERWDIFKENPPAEIRVITPRVHFTGPNEGAKAAPNGPSAWVIWKQGTTETKMTWVKRGGK